ncbi:MAG: 30S ribosomal protein S20 [Candidatus Pacebacteria bacterium]|nr:30S ribosomal protein S20 [Candidatus Paceibacterota bacterium]
MPIKNAAKKAMRSSATRRAENLRRSKTIKELDKKIRKSVEAGDKGAKELVSKFQQAVDKGEKAGLFKKNTASRKKSRMVAFVKKGIDK